MKAVTSKASGKKYPNAGHRQRLRNKFLRVGLDALADYEIIELLLSLGTPRKDCKQAAKQAIKKFGGLQGVFDASPDELKKINGIGEINYFGLKLFQAVAERQAREKIPRKININSPLAVAKYLQKAIGNKDKEYFVGLYLNSRNQIIHQETISIGTLENSLVHPREVFEPALKYHASGVIVAHNHPSGTVEATPEDIALTRRLGEAGLIIGVSLIDHVIVSKLKYYSLKAKNLL